MPNKRHENRTARMPAYALNKPLAITADGKFILPSEVEKRGATFLGRVPISSLDTSLQQKLTLERIKKDSKYDLGILRIGKILKDEVIAQVEQLTKLGKVVILAEVNYCDEFISQLTSTTGRPPKIKPRPYEVKLSTKNTVVFCEACVDELTCSAAQYRIAHVHPAFAARGFNVVSLAGASDTRANFAPEAKKPFVDYISGIGHGAPNVFTGADMRPILQVGAYDPLEVKGKVIHLLSCQTAKELGKDVVTNEAKAYSGYFEDFTTVWDSSGTQGHEGDPFWKSDSTFDICMANGYTVEQAHNATIAAYNAAIASVPNTSAATWLTWDRKYFRSPVIDAAYGDKSALAPVEATISEQEAPVSETVAAS